MVFISRGFLQSCWTEQVRCECCGTEVMVERIDIFKDRRPMQEGDQVPHWDVQWRCPDCGINHTIGGFSGSDPWTLADIPMCADWEEKQLDEQQEQWREFCGENTEVTAYGLKRDDT